MNIKEKILVVEDEKSIAHFISTVLNNNGYEAMRARTGQEALAMVSSHCPDLIILDLGLPDMDGMELLKNIRSYLTDTLFVVIRSYAAIMLLTFTELSILFGIFGIERPVLKAAVIALLDILPILGTGGIMIPWAVISLALGYTKLGIVLFIIYGIVTVIRNYVEPKIVGTQLGLHPIITLVSMFVGLRVFGFWGLFGLPVGISFLWKQRNEKQTAAQAETEPQTE